MGRVRLWHAGIGELRIEVVELTVVETCAEHQLIAAIFRYAQSEMDRVGGASEETFVITMIDRQLVNVKRDRMRDRRRANSEALSLDADLVLSEKDLFARHCWDVLELQIDVRDVLEALTPAERAICKALAEGHSQADIARTMGRSKAAISNEVHKLRGKFRCLGLADYLEIDKDDIFT